MDTVDRTIQEALRARLAQLETHFNSDVVFYFGEIHPALAKGFRDFVETLRTELRLEIKDYSNDAPLRALIRAYNDLLIEYIRRSQFNKFFMHSRNFF